MTGGAAAPYPALDRSVLSGSVSDVAVSDPTAGGRDTVVPSKIDRVFAVSTWRAVIPAYPVI